LKPPALTCVFRLRAAAASGSFAGFQNDENGF
jgi:hypothetical protein